MIKNGKYKQTLTIPHKKINSYLEELGIIYENEKILDCWTFDVYIPIYKLYIEVDGDYYHSNPKIYPNGPITNTQKINWYRDIKKNDFCKKNKIKFIRFWESDILSNKEFVICKLRELLK